MIVEADGRTVEGSFVLMGKGGIMAAKMEFSKRRGSMTGCSTCSFSRNTSHLDIARYFARSS